MFVLNETNVFRVCWNLQGFISDLSNDLDLTRGKTRSGYGSFETSDGKLFAI